MLEHANAPIGRGYIGCKLTIIMKVHLRKWTAVALWKWKSSDPDCGICRLAFDGCCPDCRVPGDDCPLGNYYDHQSHPVIPDLHIYISIGLEPDCVHCLLSNWPVIVISCLYFSQRSLPPSISHALYHQVVTGTADAPTVSHVQARVAVQRITNPFTLDTRITWHWFLQSLKFTNCFECHQNRGKL